MLFILRIKNFALVDDLELEFGKGLNVLTGETGAGKSIILDAIDIALGGKANSRMIRTGSTRALVEATFGVDRAVKNWLVKHEIELLDEDSVVCSRELSITKGSLRSRSRVNGVLVNRQLIEQLRTRLVEITAQGQTVDLMIPVKQRELLDSYAGIGLIKQRKLVASAYESYQNISQSLDKRRRTEQERLQRLDLLEYQIKELLAAELSEAEELPKLEIELDRLSHVVQLQQLTYQAYQALYQNDTEELAAADLLARAESILTDMVNYDKEIEPLLEIVRTAIAQVIEVGHQINAYGDGLQADPERLEQVESRIALLKQISRKYGPTLAEAITYYERVKQEWEELNDSGQSLEKLEREYLEVRKTLDRECAILTQLREKAAKRLEIQLVEQLKPLAMDKVIFECRLTPTDVNAAGTDRIVYYFSPNPGEKIQPISLTASGGEMSRFLLALKACFSNSDRDAKTLVFDEIDAGVSGKVAGAIAEKLHQLSQKHQILCVTHQPLVAAMADTHFRVDKQIIDPSLQQQNGNLNSSQIRTVLRVTILDDRDTRREELAQLTAGHSASSAIAFAESILTKAADRRTGNNI
ncbi:MAG: DNA repair protein RecN [Prochloraceae cyanobacterium]|nr:DNA repair protein RecN [Prochloraceae cyanobacterium]